MMMQCTNYSNLMVGDLPHHIGTLPSYLPGDCNGIRVTQTAFHTQTLLLVVGQFSLCHYTVQYQ